MKKTILILLFPVLLLILILQFNGLSVPQNKLKHQKAEASAYITTPAVMKVNKNEPLMRTSKVLQDNRKVKSGYLQSGNKGENIVNYALTLLGAPYLYGGNTRNGFDCSGFTTHVFDHNGVSIKRSSALQSTEGITVERSEAAPGDLVIFTGTDKSVREPGHVGIVISEPGDTIEFIHASSSRSDGGVKISQVEGSGYDARFLEVRRVL